MQQALALAQEAAALGEVPVGAVAVYDGKVVGHRATTAGRSTATRWRTPRCWR